MLVIFDVASVSAWGRR